MARDEILKCLVETVAEVQTLSGCAAVNITAELCPIYDLEGFDSLRGVETTILLSEKLKCKFKAGKKDVNVFISKDGRRALRIEEAASRLLELID